MKSLQGRLLYIGVLLAVSLWMAEALIHTLLEGRGFVATLFYPDLHELWMRIVVVVVVIAYSLYSKKAAARLEEAERAASEGERRFREMVETAGEGICILDRQGAVTFTNRRLQEMLGKVAAGLEGMHFSMAVHEEDRLKALGFFDKLSRGVRENYDIRFTRGDGSWLWAIVSSTPLLDDNGAFTGALSMITDLTAHKQAEEEIRKSRELYSTLAETAQDFIVIVGAGGVVEYVNSYAASRYGRPGGEIVGRTIGELLPGQLSRLKADIDAVVRTGHPAKGLEDRVALPCGDEIWIDTILMPLRAGGSADGRCTAVLLMSRDMTGRKAAEIELTRERDRAEKYFESAGVVFLILDADGKVARINTKGCEVLGRESDDMTGADWFEEFIPGRLRREIRTAFESVMSGANPFLYLEHPVITADGSERIIAWHNARMTDPGGASAVLCSGEDITERRQAEDALRERVDELERFSKVTVERELRIRELKERVAELERGAREPGAARLNG